MSKSNAVGWFEIYVEDMPRAVAFYEQVFQCKLENIADPNGEIEMMGFTSDMSAYGAGGALVKMEQCPPGVGGTMVYFSVGDCAVEEARIAAAGGAVLKPKFSIGEHGWVGAYQDTEGNVFGLHSMQ